jgi:hypothetical protein
VLDDSEEREDGIADAVSNRALSAEARHRAQLAGVAEAYFPQVKDAWGHTLKLIGAVLLPEENVVAAIGCFDGGTIRPGLLLITDLRLLWTKQSFLRRRPRYVSIRYDDMASLEFAFDKRWGRPALRPNLNDPTSGRRPTLFTFTEDRYEALPAVLNVLQGIIGGKLKRTLDPFTGHS